MSPGRPVPAPTSATTPDSPPTAGAVGAAGPIAGRRFVPLGRSLLPSADRRAIRWFLRDLFVTHGARQRALRPVARLASRLPGGWRLLGRAESAATLASDPRWREALTAAGWLYTGAGRRLLLDAGLGTDVDPLLVADYVGTGRCRTLVFLFAADGNRPAAVAKLRPSEVVGEPLGVEERNLRRLHDELPTEIASVVPDVLAGGEGDGREGLLLSVLPGRSLWADLQGPARPARRAAGELSAVGRWLGAFHAASRQDRAFPLPCWEEAAFEGEAEPAWYRRLGERLARQPLWLAGGHGDFWPRNVLLSRGAVSAVVDWEAARPAAAPFYDLFTFPWSCAEGFPWRDGGGDATATRFRLAFLADNPLSRGVAAYLRSYGDATGLDGPIAHDLFRLWLRLQPATTEGREIWRICDRMLGRAGHSVFSG